MAVYVGRNAVRKLLYLFIVALARGIHVAAEKFVHAVDKRFRQAASAHDGPGKRAAPCLVHACDRRSESPVEFP